VDGFNHGAQTGIILGILDIVVVNSSATVGSVLDLLNLILIQNGVAPISNISQGDGGAHGGLVGDPHIDLLSDDGSVGGQVVGVAVTEVVDDSSLTIIQGSAGLGQVGHLVGLNGALSL